MTSIQLSDDQLTNITAAICLSLDSKPIDDQAPGEAVATTGSVKTWVKEALTKMQSAIEAKKPYNLPPAGTFIREDIVR